LFNTHMHCARNNVQNYNVPLSNDIIFFNFDGLVMIPRSQTLTFKKRDGQKTSIFLAAGGVRSPSPTTVAMVTDEVHTTFTSLCLFGIRSTV